MRRSTKWFLAISVVLAVLAYVFVFVPHARERAAVAALLNAGAFVFYSYDPGTGVNSEPRDYFYIKYGVFDTDLSGVADSHVVGVSFNSDVAVSAFCEYADVYDSLDDIMLGTDLSDGGVIAFAKAVEQQEISLENINCYATLKNPRSFDHLSRVSCKTLLIGPTLIDHHDLTFLKRLTTLESLWLVEGKPNSGNQNSNPCRYDTQSFQEIGRLANLRSLCFLGLKVTDEMASQLQSLNLLEHCLFSNCEMSEEALDLLKKSLPDCQVRFKVHED